MPVVALSRRESVWTRTDFVNILPDIVACTNSFRGVIMHAQAQLLPLLASVMLYLGNETGLSRTTLGFVKLQQFPAGKIVVTVGCFGNRDNFLFLGKSLSMFGTLSEPVQTFSSQKIPLHRSTKEPHPPVSVIFDL